MVSSEARAATRHPHLIRASGCGGTLAFQVDQTYVVFSTHIDVEACSNYCYSLFVLKKLPQVKGAAFDSYADEDEPECHPDTRTDLLREIQNWVDNPTSKCIFWLNGMAGTGKSTIPRTVARSLADQELLGASFFTTIAAQLAIKIPGLIIHIAKALDTDPAIPDKAMKEQFEKLLLRPLSTIELDPSSNRRKLIIVIDALDECEQERHISTILYLLSRSRDLKGVSLRIFVTSRPDLPIRLGFQRIDGDAHQDVVLHEIPALIIEHDLRAFLLDELARIRHDHSLPPTWPNRADLQTLVEMARPLFIFAATVCRFVGDLYFDPQERLATVLRYQTTSQADKLDGTYLPVLNQLLVGRNDSEKDELLKDFRNIVGAIVVLIDPLPTQSLVN